MTVSSISSSMMSMYVPSVSAASDYEYERIKRELAALGIAATGDKATDKTKLETAKRLLAMKNSGQSSNTKQTVPFEDVMNTLNLKVTGDIEKDYQTTITRLDYEIGYASGNDDKKAYFQAMKDTVQSEYNSSKQNSIGAFTGANQVSSMNRYMLGI